MQKANVTGNSGLFMCVPWWRAHHIPRRAFCTQRISAPRRAWPAQFHVDSKSKTVLQTELAGDNELEAKEAA